MTTGYAIKCLVLLGHEVFKPKRARKWHVNFVDVWGTNTFTDEGLITKAIEQLTKREDVMERVCRWLNTRDNGCYKWEQLDGSECWRLVDQSNGSFNSEPVLVGWLLNYAIELSITPEQLMGVKG